MTRTLFPVANIIVIMMPFTMQGCGMLLNVVSALLLLTAMIASHPGRIFFFGSAAEEECTLGLDGACIASDGMNDALAAMKVTASEDGSVFYDTGFGVAQSVAGEKIEDTKKRLIETARYMKDRVLMASADDVLSQVAKECQLRHEHCAFWAVIGECEKNPGMMVSRAFSAEVNGNMTHDVLLLSLPAYMKLQCAPACFTCEQLAFETRCPMPGNFENVWSVGDLNRMFERIATNPYYQSKYNVQVLMRPKNETDGPEDAINDDPWVVVIDNFLTDEECDTLIRLGGEQGYLMSKDVGGKNFDGTYEAKQSSGRTSTNAWCLDKCYEDPVTKTVLAKIENLTGIPDSNAEYLQLLKYEETQFYQVHHDYIDFHLRRAQGVRILTVFLYLNDVEEGGGTNFPVLDVTVEAKRGRVLLWPSVKDENPDEKDPRTDHQALPVIKGIKYGANAWLHLRDFKTPYASNCS